LYVSSCHTSISLLVSSSFLELLLVVLVQMSLKRITISILKKNKDKDASDESHYLRLETNSTPRTDDIFMTSSYQNELNNEEQVHMATPPKLRKRSSVDSGYSRRLSSFWEEMIRQKKEKRQKEDSSKDNDDDKPLKDGVLQVQDILDKRFSDNNKSSVYLPMSSRDTKRDTNKVLGRYRDTGLSNKRGSCESYDSIMSCYHGKQLKSSTTNKKRESVLLLGMITFPCQEAEEEVRPTQEVREGQKSSSSTMSRRRGSMLTSLIDALKNISKPQQTDKDPRTERTLDLSSSESEDKILSILYK